MQVFIPYPEPIKVAKCLDRRRLNKQIIECNQILDVIDGRAKSWRNHPIMDMYRPYREWLYAYTRCLACYFQGHLSMADSWSYKADSIKPSWMTDKICDQHKRRLYTKDPEFYKDFESYGKSDMNYYIVNNEVRKYEGGFIGSESLEEFLNN